MVATMTNYFLIFFLAAIYIELFSCKFWRNIFSYNSCKKCKQKKLNFTSFLKVLNATMSRFNQIVWVDVEIFPK